MRNYFTITIGKFSKKLFAVLLFLLSTVNYLQAGILTVTTSADAGVGSLRSTVASAASGDTIHFSPGINGSAIVLTTGEIAINENLTIIGNGTANTIIDGNNASRIFNIGSGNFNILNLAIKNGIAPGFDSGGGIANNGSDIINIDHCAIVSCSATADGGAIVTNSGTMNITACSFDGNHADYDGGGIRINDGTVSITSSTFINGTTGFSGAAIRQVGGTVSVTNCTLTGNTASYNGGGLQGTMNLVNRTIAGNHASNGGGATPDGATFTNCIISNNTATGSGPDLDGDMNSGGYNIVGNTSGGGGLIGTDQVADPLLKALADNGGPTKTMAVDCHSPAYNAGLTNGAPLTDQRGAARYLAVDIGAYEFSPVQLTDVHTACKSFTWINGSTYTASTNSAIYILSNIGGCDSVVTTLHLTIDTVDVSVINNILTLTATANADAYQWLDCNNGYALLGGETNQSFTATQNGSYAVMITKGGCSDTSGCQNITNVGIENYETGPSVFAYPNPAMNQLYIESGNMITTEINIYNATGSLVYQTQQSLNKSIDISQLGAGVYVAEIKTRR